MSLKRAYVSHNQREWWDGHLKTALSRTLEVVEYPMARPNQAGHPIDTDITQLIAVQSPGESFYLGSLDQLFLGIADLALPTAVWADFMTSKNAAFIPCLKLFDMVFCSQKDSIPDLSRAGVRHVEWLPFAFDTTLPNDPDADKTFDVGFVGSLELPATREERTHLLGRLERKYRLNDYRVPAFGDDMMRTYNRSRIVVNIPVPDGFNMRTFEAMASGALLLTKRVGNGQDDLFGDGTHLVTYHDADDLLDKVDYYLRHDRERNDIARAGMREVLTKHTYDHRAARVIDVMDNAPQGRRRDKTARVEAYAAFYDYANRIDLLGRLPFDRGISTAMRLRLLTRALLKFGRRGLAYRRAGGVGSAN